MMARFYIKDLIKSMLKLDEQNLMMKLNLKDEDATQDDCKSQSVASICSKTSTNDDIDNESTSMLTDANLFSGPLHHNSLHDLEETLKNLKRENFNLKLRIYFLEERIGINFNTKEKNIIKKNIDLEAELQNFKKELNEKHMLLCQAVQAIELEEDDHKKTIVEKNKEIEDLKLQLKNFQQKYELLQSEMTAQGDQVCNELTAQDSNKLNDKIKDLELQLLKEKENVTELDNLLLLTENKQIRLTIIELENKQREEQIKKLMNELEESENKLYNFSARMKNMEDDLREKRNDIDLLKKDIFGKNNRLKEHQKENDELQNLLIEAQNMYESERMRAEKYRSFFFQRNNKLGELDNLIKKYQSKITSLESRLQTAQNEVKMHDASPASNVSSKKVQPKQIRQLHTGGNECSNYHHEQWTEAYPPLNETHSNMESLKKDLTEAKKQISKLEEEHMRACKVIQCMIDLKKKTTREIDALRNIIAQKNMEIQNLTVRKDKVNMCKGGYESGHFIPSITQSLRAKITELSLRTTINGPDDKTHTIKSSAAQMKSIILNFSKKGQ